MYMLLYTLLFLAAFTLIWVVPRRRPGPRPTPPDDDNDGGGEPRDSGLPDLDLPPGITLPINDWEPDYNRPRVPAG